MQFTAFMIPQLNQSPRDGAVGMLQADQSIRAVSSVLNVNHSTIERYDDTGSSADRPRPRRPWVTNQCQDRRIRLIHLCNRFQPSIQIAVTTTWRQNRPMGVRTVHNHLRHVGIQPYHPCTGAVLTIHHQEN
ncbi:uncharacterized protein LOC106470080 [Limulus polyphemus]|uniref:Uncharacterized protein LOC106470080 n=1 Tax=Limulus polyphemus TaxID=6850 RepID=A0ABM1BPC2_LIMPO|nr:uncharacterized protein LOC106470080 [Limulus polyphemus]